MVASKDIVLSIVGFIISLYGSSTKDLTIIILGIIFVFVGIMLSIQGQEDDIETLKAQINTQNELKKIWMRLDNLENKNDEPKRRKK